MGLDAGVVIEQSLSASGRGCASTRDPYRPFLLLAPLFSQQLDRLAQRFGTGRLDSSLKLLLDPQPVGNFLRLLDSQGALNTLNVGQRVDGLLQVGPWPGHHPVVKKVLEVTLAQVVLRMGSDDQDWNTTQSLVALELKEQLV